jgi:hypothetical protein
MHACIQGMLYYVLEYVYYMLVVLFILKKLGDTIELTCHDRPWISWLLGDLFQNGRERGGKDEKQDGAMGGRKKIYAKN